MSDRFRHDAEPDEPDDASHVLLEMLIEATRRGDLVGVWLDYSTGVRLHLVMPDSPEDAA